MMFYTEDVKKEVIALAAKGKTTPQIYCALKMEPKPSLRTINRWTDSQSKEKERIHRANRRAERREIQRRWQARQTTAKDKAPPKAVHPCMCETPMMTRDLHDDEPTCLFCGRRAESASGRPQQNTR